MHAVYLQQVLDASNASVQRWTLVLPASNACRWLTVVLKRRFCFARRFLRFIASLACCNPYACCPTLCFSFAPRFASFSVFSIVFRVLHRFSVPLHSFPRPFASFFALRLVFRASHCFPHFTPFSAPTLLYRLHVTCIAWFPSRFALSPTFAFRAMMLTT